MYTCITIPSKVNKALGHSFVIFSLTGDFEKKWSRGDEIKI